MVSAVELVGYEGPAETPEKVLVLQEVPDDYDKTILLRLTMKGQPSSKEYGKLKIHYDEGISIKGKTEDLALSFGAPGHKPSQAQGMARLLDWLVPQLSASSSAARPTEAELTQALDKNLPHYPAAARQEFSSFFTKAFTR